MLLRLLREAHLRGRLADARKEKLLFQIYRHGESAFEPTDADGDGFQLSDVLGCAYRLERFREEDGYWGYTLAERQKSE